MLLNEPLWYKDAVFYELHVRAYGDENGDGYGDFIGLTRKLDYLQDLGVTAIWLLPFYPSPLRDDGYDIANYTDIHPQYGKLGDFREFLTQAHDRGLRVITELVVNHTSEQHPWFQRARRAPPGSSERDFYVWSDTPDKYRDARVIFKDFETSNWTYDPVARAYYWHRFYSHQPDLNFDNPDVWKALLPVVDFWFEMGVDGMRLDAVPYLFEREGTNCENLPQTHEYLKSLRRHIDERFPNRLLLAEANQWPEDAVAYFGEGDECHMAFHFPVMPRLFMAMHMEDRFPVVDILNQTPTIPENCQWAMFLRNHDELTLEMVTDEERDYMYRAYAHDRQARVNLGIRRRLAPLLGNNRRRIELMNGLLFSLPGTPVLYYGDEIGMGDNIYLGDRNGVRTPMQWSADRNAGFSRANPQRLYLPINIDPEYHYEAVNVEAQQNNPSSLLWWMKRLIGQRRLHKALGRGSIEFLHPQNRRILAFIREFDGEHILVVANLSRFVQHVELDLSKYSGVVPCELFGGTPFPRIGSLPYLLTFGPHSFYWIRLQPQFDAEGAQAAASPARPFEIREDDPWEHLFTRSRTRRLELALRQYLEQIATQERRRRPRAVRLRESFRIPFADTAAHLAIVDVEYAERTPETLAIPIAFLSSAEVALWTPGTEPTVIARIEGPLSGVLVPAYSIPAFREALLPLLNRQSALSGSDGGELHVGRSPQFDSLCDPEADAPGPSLVSAPYSNTSIQYGNRVVLKVYRHIEDGTHPEPEIGRFLTDVRPFEGVAPLAATVEYRSRRSEPMALAVLHGFVPNEGDAWQYTLDLLSVFFEQVATIAPLPTDRPPPLRLKLNEHDALPPPLATELLHGYLDMIRLLGKRLAELHRALAGTAAHADFAPEPFSLQYQRSIYQSMRNLLFDVLYDLERTRETMPPETAARAAEIPLFQGNILRELHLIVNSRIDAARIHCHGDCQLHQILFTGKDFVFIDFEGRPTQSVGERWNKSSPLRDVVALLRSFDYAAHGALFGLASGRGRATGVVRPEDRQTLVPWLRIWRTWVHDALLRGYLETCAGDALLPANAEERNLLFRVFLLDKLLSEIDAELVARPNWLEVPLSGLLEAVKRETDP